MKKIKIPYVEHTWDNAVKLAGVDNSEFLSDFCLFKDASGLWHAIGTGGQGHVQDSFFHAAGRALAGLAYEPRIESGRSAMEWMWAPFAIQKPNGGDYLLFYCHREGGFYQMRVLTAREDNLTEWKQLSDPELQEGNIAFLQKDSRDPCIFFDNTLNGYVCYYSAAFDGEEYSKIFARTSSDLIHWNEARLVMEIPDGYVAAESPFVHRKNGLYYLFVSGFDYSRVSIYAGEGPFDFGAADKPLTEIPGHAPEIVTENGRDYIACSAISTKPSGSPGEHDLSGLYIQELLWK